MNTYRTHKNYAELYLDSELVLTIHSKHKGEKRNSWNEDLKGHHEITFEFADGAKCSFDFWASIADPTCIHSNILDAAQMIFGDANTYVNHAIYPHNHEDISLDNIEEFSNALNYLSSEFGYDKAGDALRVFLGCRETYSKLTEVMDPMSFDVQFECIYNALCEIENHEIGKHPSEQNLFERFKQEVLPNVAAKYEKDGTIDRPARYEAWNNWIDSLEKNDELVPAISQEFSPEQLDTARVERAEI
jgi:hypothetical protein